MNTIALDLMLLLFILSIWRYWIEAAWKGGGNHFAPIARLIFTVGLIMIWRVIYAFEVELTNEMIHTIFFKTVADLDQLRSFMGIVLSWVIEAGIGLTDSRPAS